MSILEWLWPKKPLNWDVLIKKASTQNKGVELVFGKAFQKDGRWFVENVEYSPLELCKGGEVVGNKYPSLYTMTWENIDHRSMGI